MKITWEEKDIVAGLRFCNSDSQSEYIVACDCNRVNVHDRYGVVSLADGMWTWLGYKSAVAMWMNTAGNFIPITLRKP